MSNIDFIIFCTANGTPHRLGSREAGSESGEGGGSALFLKPWIIKLKSASHIAPHFVLQDASLAPHLEV